MSKYDNNAADPARWTNHKLCVVICNGLGSAPTDKPFHDALDVLQGRVVRHQPSADYDERGQPRTPEVKADWIAKARESRRAQSYVNGHYYGGDDLDQAYTNRDGTVCHNGD